MQDDWLDIVRRIRRYAARKYGRHAIGISIDMIGQERPHYEPFPPATPEPEEEKPRGGPAGKM